MKRLFAIVVAALALALPATSSAWNALGSGGGPVCGYEAHIVGYDPYSQRYIVQYVYVCRN